MASLPVESTIVNQRGQAPTSLQSLTVSLWRQRDLLRQLTVRDIRGRYRGSMLGLFWSFVNPLVLLAIYTFVFSVVFEARWGEGAAGQPDFAVRLFAGMIVHGLLSEVLQRSPTLLLANVSYVKKVVFPLELLPPMGIGTALFHAAIGGVILLGAILAVHGSVPPTALWLPLILSPLLLLCLGLSYLLVSIGTYVRDIAQPMSLLSTVLLFGSPVFYPLSALPEGVRPWLILNPLTVIIEQVRAVLIEGQQPDFRSLAIYGVLSLLTLWAGYFWFQKTRKGFANVV